MSDLRRELDRTVRRFVAQITELARHAALEALRAAYRARVAARSPARRIEPPRDGRPRDHRRSYRPRRSPLDLGALSEQFTAFVLANPGLRIEQINVRLGTTTKALALPIRRLVADGAIHTRGHGRSMTYFALEKPGAEPPPSVFDGPTPGVEPTGGQAVKHVGAVPTRDDWYSCLAGVFLLVQRLQK